MKKKLTSYQEDDAAGEEESKRPRLFYALAVLAFFVVALVFVAFNMFKGNIIQTGHPGETSNAGRQYNYVAPTNDDCLKLKNSDDVQQCLDLVIAAEAADNRDYDKCLTIKTESLKNDCCLNAARNLADSELCLRMQDEQTQGRCFSDVAGAKKDPSICKLMPEARDYEIQECMDRTMSFVIAEDGDKENLDKCAKLQTLEYGKLCLSNSYRNKFGDDCDLVPKEYQGYCVAEHLIEGFPEIGECAGISLDKPQETINYREFCVKVAQMGLVAASRIDSDRDGIADGNELFMNLNPNNPDTDGDGLGDGEEWIIYSTDPAKKDSDNDGIDDY